MRNLWFSIVVVEEEILWLNIVVVEMRNFWSDIVVVEVENAWFDGVQSDGITCGLLIIGTDLVLEKETLWFSPWTDMLCM